MRKVWRGIGAEIGGGLDRARGTRSSAACDRQDHVRKPDIEEDEERADIAETTATGRR